MAKLPISVCIISGSEAHRIRPALQSVAGWTSEIILVLNEEASDGTDTIAKEFGAAVFREPWKGFVAQKNSVAEKATGEWLLSLDADEVVSPELRDEIVEVLGSPHDSEHCAGFSFPRCSRYFGRWIRHGDWYPDRKLRLWRRGCARWVGGALHEQLQADGRIGRLKGELLHYGTESVDAQVRKAMRYSHAFAHPQAARRLEARTIDLLVRPWWRFFRGYFLKLGFLDGWQGLCLSWMTAFYTFFRYFKTLEATAEKTN
jgi:glycosyltransferase involved in cell wall biosynthesis